MIFSSLMSATLRTQRSPAPASSAGLHHEDMKHFRPVLGHAWLCQLLDLDLHRKSGKYKLVFSGSAQEIDPITYGDAPSGFMQGPRYTTLAKLKAAKTLPDIS